MKGPTKPKSVDETERLVKRIWQLEDAITTHREEIQGSEFKYEDHPTYAPEARLYAVLESEW